MTLFDWLRTLDDLIFPAVPLCAFCRERKISSVGCCVACLDSLAVDWQQGEAHGYSYYSLLPYQGFTRDQIHKMKYLDGWEIACTFGFLLALALREEPSLRKIDYLVPVPLHFNRFSQRGFNQAAVIADSIKGGWKRSVFAGVVRLKETGMQSGLSLKERRRNLRGAFGMLPGRSLRGKHCLVIDDVITSGFTFRAMAQLIVDYGGKPQGVFVARTENRGG